MWVAGRRHATWAGAGGPHRARDLRIHTNAVFPSSETTHSYECGVLGCEELRSCANAAFRPRPTPTPVSSTASSLKSPTRPLGIDGASADARRDPTRTSATPHLAKEGAMATFDVDRQLDEWAMAWSS